MKTRFWPKTGAVTVCALMLIALVHLIIRNFWVDNAVEHIYHDVSGTIHAVEYGSKFTASCDNGKMTVHIIIYHEKVQRMSGMVWKNGTGHVLAQIISLGKNGEKVGIIGDGQHKEHFKEANALALSVIERVTHDGPDISIQPNGHVDFFKADTGPLIPVPDTAPTPAPAKAKRSLDGQIL